MGRCGITYQVDGRATRLSTVDARHARELTFRPWPGLPTDAAPLIAAGLVSLPGMTTITDLVYDSRSSHVPGLKRQGFDLRHDGGQQIQIRGCEPHRLPVQVQAPDIRAGAALLIASLAREAKTELTNYAQIQRGYEDCIRDLQQIGFPLRRVTAPLVPAGATA
ncbi:hypothetical protein [Deinococcus multiflagellatus]|uniref:UDP-N-acetylglucosamine 1-carboxyvinyltransferase n=2 Tax=Deinococcus multiflagellatus TaxID=1656887 RepID=A0ABW1ZTD8_9DEIO